jgi:peptide/nickel transport system substrate-binding protein
MKKLCVILLALIMIFSISGCGTGKGGGDVNDSARTDLRIAVSGEPDSLDPHYTMDSASFTIIKNVCDPLIEITTDGTEKNRLLDSYSISEDGLIYTFVIKEGVKFQNGSPFNAGALKKNLDRAKASPYYETLLEKISETVVVDDKTVEVKLSDVFPPVFRSIVTLPVIDTDEAEKVGDDAFARNPVGTGAYKFESWSAGQSLTLIANPDYYEGEPPIKNLEFRIIPDSNAMLIALENGEVDTALEIASQDIETVKSNPDLQFQKVPMIFIEFLYANCSTKQFKDAKVRKAVYMAVDKQAIIDVAFDGNAEISNQYVTPAYQHFDPNAPAMKRDVEGAKKLLAEAGYPDGFKTKITAMDGFRAQAAEVIQANLAEIGIDAEIELLEYGTMLEVGAQGDFDLYIMELATLDFETYYMYLYNFATSLWGEGGNYARTGDETLDADIAAYGSELDSAKQEALIKKMNAHIEDQGYVLPLFTRESNVAANAALKGVYADPIGMVEFRHFSW